MSVRVRFKGDNNKGYSGGVGHSGGVAIFVEGEAVVSESVLQELQEAGLSVEKIGDIKVDDSPATSYFATRRAGHAAAAEKESLSKLNVVDDHALGTLPFPDEYVGRFVQNNDDSTVPVVNTNSALAAAVDPDYDKSHQGIPYRINDVEDEEARDRVRSKARKLKKAAGVKTDEDTDGKDEADADTTDEDVSDEDAFDGRKMRRSKKANDEGTVADEG